MGREGRNLFLVRMLLPLFPTALCLRDLKKWGLGGISLMMEKEHLLWEVRFLDGVRVTAVTPKELHKRTNLLVS